MMCTRPFVAHLRAFLPHRHRCGELQGAEFFDLSLRVWHGLFWQWWQFHVAFSLSWAKLLWEVNGSNPYLKTIAAFKGIFIVSMAYHRETMAITYAYPTGSNITDTPAKARIPGIIYLFHAFSCAARTARANNKTVAGWWYSW